MKDFIEVMLADGTNSTIIIALSSIAAVDSHSVRNARIVTNFKLQHPDKNEVIVTVQSYHQVKELIKEAQK